MNKLKGIYKVLSFIVLIMGLTASYINMNSLQVAIENSDLNIFYPLISLIYLFLFLVMYFLVIQLSNKNISRIPNILIISIFSLIIGAAGIKLCSILMVISIF